MRRYSCFSVGLTQRSVCNVPLISTTLTSEKEISDLENELVNLIVGCRLFKYVMNSNNVSSPCDIQGRVRPVVNITQPVEGGSGLHRLELVLQTSP